MREKSAGKPLESTRAYTRFDSNSVSPAGVPLRRHHRARRLADGLTDWKVDALLRKWLSRLPHPFTSGDRQAGIRYDVSVLQAEFVLIQVFDRPVQGRVFFEEVMRENLDLGGPDHVQLIFDRRVIKRTPSPYRSKRYFRRGHPVTACGLQALAHQAVPQGRSRPAHRDGDQRYPVRRIGNDHSISADGYAISMF